jgi:hypothetical protein
MLATMAAMVKTLGQKRVNPWVNLRPIAHPTSSKPATNKINHAKTTLLS